MLTPGQIAARLRENDLVATSSRSLAGAGIDGWVVGGAIRDVALGGDPGDVDLAVHGDPSRAARAVASELGGFAFELSASHGTWRVVPRSSRIWHIDITALRADGGIEADLAERDFTIGALALPLAGGDLIDPHGGLGDLAAARLRAVSKRIFDDDPLRLMRAVRLAAGLKLEIEPDTAALARDFAHRATDPAPERLLEELRQLIGGADPERGLELAEHLGILAPVLPELTALRGVDQGPNHHLDVYDHTIEVLRGVIDIERHPGHYVGEERADEVEELLAEPLSDGFTRGEALRMGALLHDIGKPATRTEHEGMIRFPGHDEAGDELINELGDRLHFSRRLKRHLRGMAMHHLRLGFLVHHMPLGAREVLAYLKVTGDAAADITLLTVADRLAARGTSGLASEKMVNAHLDLARQMVEAALDLRRDGMPEPLLRGDELADALGIEAGPELAVYVEELAAAQYAGEVDDRESALAHMREFRPR